LWGFYFFLSLFCCLTPTFLQTQIHQAHALGDFEQAKKAITSDLLKLQSQKKSAASQPEASSMESSPSSSSIKLDPDVRDVLDYTLQILLAQICVRGYVPLSKCVV